MIGYRLDSLTLTNKINQFFFIHKVLIENKTSCLWFLLGRAVINPIHLWLLFSNFEGINKCFLKKGLIEHTSICPFVTQDVLSGQAKQDTLFFYTSHQFAEFMKIINLRQKYFKVYSYINKYLCILSIKKIYVYIFIMLKISQLYTVLNFYKKNYETSRTFFQI